MSWTRARGAERSALRCGQPLALSGALGGGWAPCRLVEEYPERAVAWFGVGCYYMCTRQFDSARRYFGKSTALDPKFAPAWIGFGNAFAAQDESDQVMLPLSHGPSSPEP